MLLFFQLAKHPERRIAIDPQMVIAAREHRWSEFPTIDESDLLETAVIYVGQSKFHVLDEGRIVLNAIEAGASLEAAAVNQGG